MRACSPAAAPETAVCPSGYRALQEAVRYGFIRAGIDASGPGPHLLRRFYATHARKLASMGDVREAMGHASESMTQHYITTTVQEQARVTDALRESVLFGEVRGKVN